MATTEKFYLKQHDLLPELILTLLDGDVPADLVGATSARLMLRSLVAGLIVDGDMTVIQDQDELATTKGKVKYTWVDGDTDLIGTFNGEVEVMFGAKPETFPGNGYFHVVIGNDLDD
jgi:hypothetical protein